jgi:hypothetical protein
LLKRASRLSWRHAGSRGPPDPDHPRRQRRSRRDAVTRPAEPLDWQRIERWTTAIVAGAPAEVREVFAAAGARGPELRWNPPLDSLETPQHRFLRRYWDDLRGGRQWPQAEEIDAIELKPALGYVNLLDAIEDGHDFRYRVFGSVIASVSGIDLTGRLASTPYASPYIVEFGIAAFRAARRRGEVLSTEHGPPATVYTASWHRLVLPFGDDRGEVTRLLVGMVPMTHDGKPVIPRL